MSTVLIVANKTLVEYEVREFMQSRLGGDTEFTLLVPATAQAHPEQNARMLGTISGGIPRQDAVHRAEEATDYESARSRLEVGLNILRRLGATADGQVGDPDPTRAISELLKQRQFDEVVVFTLPAGISRWLHLDLPHQVKRMFSGPVTVITTG